MIALKAYFPNPSSIGFVVFRDEDNSDVDFVQTLNLANNKVCGFSRVDFTDCELVSIMSPTPIYQIGMDGVVAKRLASGAIELIKVPEVHFDLSFCKLLDGEAEHRNYVNSVVREIGWRNISNNARNEAEAIYIKENLSSLDFEINHEAKLTFKDFSGKFDADDEIIRTTLEDTKSYLSKSGILESLQSLITDEFATDDREIFDLNEVSHFISSSRRQEERIARLFRILLKMKRHQQRVQLLESFRDRAKFANSIVDFLKSRLSDFENEEHIELVLANNISGMYNRSFWSSRFWFLHELAIYLHDFPAISDEIKRIVIQSRSFPMRKSGNVILELLDTKVICRDKVLVADGLLRELD